MTAHPADLLASGQHMGLVIAAHPDDETLGAAGLMPRLRGCFLVHVTDGAPRDRRFWRGAEVRTRAGYARLRRRELMRALRLAGVAPRSVSSLGVADQEATPCLPRIARGVARAMMALQPGFVITHAYEGGHPDHDAVALAVWAAGRLLARRGITPPPVLEMALYHGAPGRLEAGRFLSRCGHAVPGDQELGPPEVELVLTGDALRRKRAMIHCFESQAETLAPLRDLAVERYRMAPGYDFTQAPHPGPLLYEQWGFPVSSAAWRAQAAGALRGLGLAGDPEGARP